MTSSHFLMEELWTQKKATLRLMKSRKGSRADLRLMMIFLTWIKMEKCDILDRLVGDCSSKMFPLKSRARAILLSLSLPRRLKVSSQCIPSTRSQPRLGFRNPHKTTSSGCISHGNSHGLLSSMKRFSARVWTTADGTGVCCFTIAFSLLDPGTRAA